MENPVTDDTTKVNTKKNKPNHKKLELESVTMTDLQIKKLFEILINHEKLREKLEKEKELKEKKIEENKIKQIEKLKENEERMKKQKLLEIELDSKNFLFGCDIVSSVNEMDPDQYTYMSLHYPDIKEVVDTLKKLNDEVIEPLKKKYHSVVDDDNVMAKPSSAKPTTPEALLNDNINDDNVMAKPSSAKPTTPEALLNDNINDDGFIHNKMDK